MRLFGSISSQAGAAQSVHLVGDSLKVSWIAASSISAQMVNFKPIRYWSALLFVH
jgi:hypothetical protein